jgi:hypothetical protein
VETDFAAVQIDLSVLADDHAFLQVDDPVLAEAGHRLAGPGVQRHEPIANGDEEDTVVAFAVGPV